MRPSDVTSALQALLPTRRPVYLWGPPGVGKSSLVRQAAEALGLDVVDIRAVLLDPVDLRGLPHVNGENRAHWCQPAFLPTEGQGVLFLDELAQGPPLVQSSCLQLTLDRRIGEYQLPEGWSVVAASNRQEDRAGAHRLISPLLNRFIHLDLEVSHEDWQAWALASGVAPEVRSFLSFKTALLHDFNASANERAFPTPRSWSFVSDVLRVTPDHLLHPIVAGAVGSGPAAEFVAFTRIYRDLPDPDSVLANPAGATVPKDPAVNYALVGSLVERIRKADARLLGAFAQYASRLSDEFSVLAMRDGGAVNQKLFAVPQTQAWLRTHRHVFPDLQRS
jgi:hypothetical protein